VCRTVSGRTEWIEGALPPAFEEGGRSEARSGGRTVERPLQMVKVWLIAALRLDIASRALPRSRQVSKRGKCIPEATMLRNVAKTSSSVLPAEHVAGCDVCMGTPYSSSAKKKDGGQKSSHDCSAKNE